MPKAKNPILTAKQENFCKCVALEGMNYSDAYRQSYNIENMKNESISRKAYELIENGKVTARIEELKKEINDKTIKKFVKTREDLLNEIEELKAQCIETEKKIKLDCVKEQGRLLGFYEDNVNIKGSVDIHKSLNLFKSRLNKGDK